MPRPKHQIVRMNKNADSLEASLRVSFVRAMKQLQKATSINMLAMSLSNHRQAKDQIPTKAIQTALTTLTPILVKAFMQGGKLGEQHLRELARKP